MSIRPHRCTAAAAMRATESRSVTSVWTASACSPSLLRADAAAFAPASSTSATTTSAPSARRTLPMPNPIPCAPPVTMATWPSRSCMPAPFPRLPAWPGGWSRSVQSRGERSDRPVEGPALLPERAVAGRREGLQPGAGDPLGDVCTRQRARELVVLTEQDQRRDVDLRQELAVVAQRLVEQDRAADHRRDLEDLGGHPLQRPGIRVMEHELAELAHNLGLVLLQLHVRVAQVVHREHAELVIVPGEIRRRLVDDDQA